MATHSFGPGSSGPSNSYSGSPAWNQSYSVAALRAGLVARVSNLGRAAVPAGEADVLFSAITNNGETPLGSTPLPVPLAPGASVRVELEVPLPLAGSYRAKVEPRAGVHWAECAADDDEEDDAAHCLP